MRSKKEVGRLVENILQLKPLIKKSVFGTLIVFFVSFICI